MIDEGAIVRIARDRHAAALGEQVPIESPCPRQIPGLFLRIQPACAARDVENRIALRGGSGAVRNRVDAAAIGGKPKHPAHDVVVCAGQVIVDHCDLAIGKPLLEKRVLDLDAYPSPWHPEQIGKRVQSELEPGHPLQLALMRYADSFGERRQMLLHLPPGGGTSRAHTADDDLPELLAMDFEEGPE